MEKTMTLAKLDWTEEKSAHLRTSSFTTETGDGMLRIDHHRRSDDIVRLRFTLPMQPEFADYAAFRAACDAHEHGTPERDRLNAMTLGNSEIGYFKTADDAMRLLEVARAGTDKSVAELLTEAGFKHAHTLEYPEQGRTVAIYRKGSKSGFFTIYVENDSDVHLAYEGKNSVRGHRNLMDVSFAMAHGNGKFTKLFWPSFVTTQTAMLMAVTFAAQYLAAGRTGREKR